jgi:DNA-binding NtrC family response regulator
LVLGAAEWSIRYADEVAAARARLNQAPPRLIEGGLGIILEESSRGAQARHRSRILARPFLIDVLLVNGGENPMSQALPDAGCIAVVDDEPVVRTLMRLWLEADGYSVVELPSGEEAIGHDVRGSAAVCLDLRLDDMPGIDVLHALRARDPDLPVIVVSGDQDTETVEEAMRAGAYDYVLKPFERDRLRYAVRRAFERRALVASLRELREGTSGHGVAAVSVEALVSAPAEEALGEEGLNLRDLERRAIARALEVSGGSVGKAAKLLGIGRATLYRRLSEQRDAAPPREEPIRSSNGSTRPGAHGLG